MIVFYNINAVLIKLMYNTFLKDQLYHICKTFKHFIFHNITAFFIKYMLVVLLVRGGGGVSLSPFSPLASLHP